MFDLFGRNRNDNERDDGRPQIVFANLRRPNRPILTEAGYKAFSATAFSGWALVIIVVWIFRINISLSQELATALASSGVELAALSLAVLGILHELNKEDRWFKLGLLLVSILFVGVVLSGFFLALTWQPDFALPQQITVVVVVILGLVAILQIDWKIALRLTRIRWGASMILPTRISSTMRWIRLGIPFVLPFVLVWMPGLNRVAAVVALFVGALIALVVLMAVTSLSLLKSKEETTQEDPFLATLRARYETEIKAIIRIGELKARAIDALRYLQTESRKAGLVNDQPPSPIAKSSIVVRLRQMNIMDDERILDTVLVTLVSESLIYREGYDSFWTVPDEQTVTHCSDHLKALAIITSREALYSSKTDYIIGGYKFTFLREWLAIRSGLPVSVVGEYVMPKVLEVLLDPRSFFNLRDGYRHIFVNHMWKISSEDWNNRLNEIQDKFGKKYSEHRVLNIFLNSLPHINDFDDMTIEHTKGTKPFNYDEAQIEEIVLVLSGQRVVS